MLRLLPAVLLIGFAACVQAETYKWVDEKGVTNYSNHPPAAAKAKAVQQVEERISYYETDPGLKAAAARPSLPSHSDAEWLQRQQIMAMRASYVECSWPYNTAGCGYDLYSGAYYPVVVGARRAVFRPGFTSARHANMVHSGTGGRRGAQLR